MGVPIYEYNWAMNAVNIYINKNVQINNRQNI